MMRLICLFLISGTALLSVSACNVDSLLGSISNARNSDTPSHIEVRTPQPSILSSVLAQNIDPITTTLSLSVQTDRQTDSQTFNAKFDDDTASWIAKVKIPPGNSAEFALTWSKEVRDQPLKIVHASKIVAIPKDIKQLDLDIASDEYNLSFDADADGLTNLHEISNSTNPLDSSDPDASLAKLEVNVKLEFPDDVVDIEKFAEVIPTIFLNGTELTLSFDRNADEQDEPVSDAEFDKVIRNFNALSRAIENKDTEALDRLAVSSQQSDLFKHLIQNDYDRIEVSIDDIQLRNIDKSIMGTLQIDSLIRPNGDRSSLSEKYTSRKITSRRVNGDWSKIEW